MQICHGMDESEEWAPLAENFRAGGKQYKTLLEGSEGAPDNYRLVLVRQTGPLNTPRHKHNFDQLRLCIAGRINYGRDRWIEPGEIAYFPEGTAYGPEICDCERLGITIQFGGASRSGFMSERQTQAGVAALQRHGRFESGVYQRAKAAAGERRNQDSYEAIWETVNGRRLVYPAPRYDEPVLMRAQDLAWQGATKRLGAFDGGPEVTLLRIAAGGTERLAARAGVRLGFVLSGSGRAGGETLRPLTAFALEAGEGVELGAENAIETLLVDLPIFA